MEPFDVVVVGAGMIGSAAARHLVLNTKPPCRICLVGPMDNATGTARGQHFDLARITRRMDLASPFWAKWADRSILRYRELEAESGISFYDPCGMLWLCTDEQSASIRENVARAEMLSGGAEFVKEVGDQKTLDSFSVNVSAFCPPVVMVEGPGASGGTVHPHNLVQAQIKVAAARGGSRFSHVALVTHKVTKVASDGHEDDCYYVVQCTDASGAAVELKGRKVVVSCGSMSSVEQLLPEGRSLDVELVPEMALLVPVTPKVGDANNSPPPPCPSVINTSGPLSTHFYCLPPRYYSEYGKWFTKLGASAHTNELPDRFTSVAEIVRWCDGETKSSPALVETFVALVQKLYGRDWVVEPSRQVDGVGSSRSNDACIPLQCVFDRTPHGHPMIGCVDGDGWFVACGGNGKAAKSSDELGRLVAELVVSGSFEDAERCPVLWRNC